MVGHDHKDLVLACIYGIYGIFERYTNLNLSCLRAEFFSSWNVLGLTAVLISKQQHALKLEESLCVI